MFFTYDGLLQNTYDEYLLGSKNNKILHEKRLNK